MTRQDLKRAAATAKLLGYRYSKAVYKVAPMYHPSRAEANKTHPAPPPDSELIQSTEAYVHSPNGGLVCKWTASPNRAPIPDAETALMCVQVRLHMEKHYGIKFEHYWKENTEE